MTNIRFAFVLFLLQMVYCNERDLKVITKIPKSPLLKYYSYSRVMILHFYIPLDTTEASFKFKARDDPTSMFSISCEPRNVSIFMKRGSYPVINPDGIPFPKSFLNISRPEITELTLQTDLKANYINFTSPTPGDWFAVAFVSWSDPNKDRIHQQGLSSDCEASLYAELSVKEIPDINTLSMNTLTKFILEPNKNSFYKFYVPENIDHVLITIQIITPCKTCENITILVQTGSIPNEDKHQEELILDGKHEIADYIYFWPEEENWHYINISMSENLKNKVSKNFAQISINLKYFSGLKEQIYTNITDTRIKNYYKTAMEKQLTVKTKALQYNIPYKQYNLMRITGNDNFMYEYDFHPNKNGSTPLLLNITSYEMTVLKFTVHEIIDIGGTLSIGLAIKPELKTNLAKMGNFTVVSCIRANVKEIPIYPNLCVFNDTQKPAPIILNSTKAGTLEYLHIPFPDPGTYYMSIRAFYDNTCVPCNCSESCETMYKNCLLDCEMNCTDCDCIDNCEDDILSKDDCVDCNCDGNCLKPNETDTKNTSVIFTISSFPCIAGKCGSRGRCNHYMAGGFIFSSCQCTGGYRGWDCSDDSQAKQDSEILLAILLLTLSNLLFIPSIFFAYRRGYYTEAVVYFFSMVFSTFYHACDSKENQYGFCLFPLGVLQFCDFYCGLLNIWVTLVAMSYTDRKIISIAHLAGAIILAFSVTYNKHALWVFILPAVCGLVLIGINWGLQCRTTKKIFPAKTYLKIYMPIGAGLVLMGLISYAFLETNENYKIIHSLWHVVMALSLIFLLPDKNTFVPKY